MSDITWNGPFNVNGPQVAHLVPKSERDVVVGVVGERLDLVEPVHGDVQDVAGDQSGSQGVRGREAREASQVGAVNVHLAYRIMQGMCTRLGYLIYTTTTINYSTS